MVNNDNNSIDNVTDIISESIVDYSFPTGLNMLQISDSYLGDLISSQISNLANLTYLDLDTSSLILTPLNKLINLTYFKCIKGNCIDSSTLKHLSELPELRYLVIRSSIIDNLRNDNVSVQYLSKCKNLIYLDIRYGDVLTQTVVKKIIDNLKQLRVLFWKDDHESNLCYKYLNEHKTLQYVSSHSRKHKKRNCNAVLSNTNPDCRKVSRVVEEEYESSLDYKETRFQLTQLATQHLRNDNKYHFNQLAELLYSSMVKYLEKTHARLLELVEIDEVS